MEPEQSQLKDEDYRDFYRFVANAFDEPIYRCVFTQRDMAGLG